jgi:hypothetical protein
MPPDVTCRLSRPQRTLVPRARRLAFGPGINFNEPPVPSAQSVHPEHPYRSVVQAMTQLFVGHCAGS